MILALDNASDAQTINYQRPHSSPGDLTLEEFAEMILARGEERVSLSITCFNSVRVE
jgi:hypothetical protein